MPVPGNRLESEMALRRKVALHATQGDHNQHDGAQRHVHTVEAGQHEKRRSVDTRFQRQIVMIAIGLAVLVHLKTEEGRTQRHRGQHPQYQRTALLLFQRPVRESDSDATGQQQQGVQSRNLPGIQQGKFTAELAGADQKRRAADSLARTCEAALDEINKTRREIESTMREQAFAYVETLERRKWPSCVCVFDASWHQGVVGLVAARVREKCHRPVIAFAREGDGRLKGSARSIAGVHARDLLEAVSSRHPGLIVKFGGHAMAAGLTIAEKHYDDFAGAVTEQAKRLYPDADFSGAIVTDGVISADDIARWGGLLQGARALREAGPWGSGFPEPTWSGDFELLEQRTVGENHLKMRLRPVSGETVVDAIAFNQAGPAYRGNVQLAFRLDVNEYRGVENPQLVVEQIASLQGSSA